MPAMHQVALLEALAVDHRVVLVTDSGVSAQRMAMGWADPLFSGVEVHIAPDASQRMTIIHEAGLHAIHVLSGFRAYPGVRSAMSALIHLGRSIGVYVEPWRMGQLKSPLRAVIHRADALRLRRHLSFVLATGPTAMAQQQAAGLGDLAYEFGYFVDSPGVEGLDSWRATTGHVARRTRFAFVGTVDERKNLGALLRAFSTVEPRSWSLDVYGEGPHLSRCQAIARQSGFKDEVRWHGFVPNRVIREILRESDVLALPSLFDGWGTVVNEALHAGAKALVSDRVGARALLREDSRGLVHRCGDQRSLEKSLQRLCTDGPLTATARVTIAKWAEARISGTAAARYFEQIIAHMEHRGSRPFAPWTASTLSR